jgi:hypothetical protein
MDAELAGGRRMDAELAGLRVGWRMDAEALARAQTRRPADGDGELRRKFQILN